MKTTIILILLFISGNCISQSDTICGRIPVHDNKVSYQEVISVDSLTKEMLYKNTLNWISQNYMAPDKVINYKDDVNKERIIINAVGDNTPYKYGGVNMICTFKYRLQIDFKDGKYKYELSNITCSCGSGYNDINPFVSKSEAKYSTKLLLSIDSPVVVLLGSLKNGINGTKKQEW